MIKRSHVGSFISFLDRPLYVSLFMLYVFIIVALPSSKVFDIPVRDMILTVMVLSYMLSKRELKVKISLVYSFIFFFFAVLLSSLNSVVFSPSNSDILGQLRLLLNTVMPIFLFYLLGINKNEYYKNLFLVAVFRGIIFYSLAKLAFVVIPLFTVYDTPILYELVYGLASNKWEIVPGLYRSQYINDTLIVFLFFTMLPFLKKENILIKYLSIIAVVFILIASFSRFNIFVFAVIFISYFLVFKEYRFLLVVFLIFLILFIFNVDFFVDLINVRLNPKYNNYSDEIRLVQFNYLLEMFLDKPLLGHGFGTYPYSYQRQDINLGLPFLFELQMFSFLGQFGLLGFVVIILILLLPVKRVLTLEKRFGVKAVFLICYTFFVLSSFTNPYLLSPISGLFILIVISFVGFDINKACNSKC